MKLSEGRYSHVVLCVTTRGSGALQTTNRESVFLEFLEFLESLEFLEPSQACRFDSAAATALQDECFFHPRVFASFAMAACICLAVITRHSPLGYR